MYSHPESPGTKVKRARNLKAIQRFRSEGVDEDMSDRIITSKKLFMYEDRLFTFEERQQRLTDNIVSAEVDEFNQRYAQIIDPKDTDLNYNRIEKIPNEYIYEVIEEQINKKNTKAQEVLKVFGKRNDNVNFFLCDFEGIIENQEIDLSNDSMLRKTPKSTTISAARKDAIFNPNMAPYNAQAVKDAYSQGKSFFFIEKGLIYECIREYDDGLYIELRNKDIPDQIGLFKKKDVVKMIPPTAEQGLLGSSSSGDLFSSQEYPNINEEGEDQMDSDDRSDNSSQHYWNSNNNHRNGKNLQIKQQQQTISKKVNASRKSSVLATPSKVYTNTSINSFFNSKISGGQQQSTAASKRFY